MRKVIFSEGEFYHIYNRGVDKRTIFKDRSDMERFLKSMQEFNTTEPIGSIYERSFREDVKKKEQQVLVHIVAYCLNLNHYHMVLKQVSERGIIKFMQRLGTGYTNYFNERYTRSGALFQGRYKAKHIDSNEYLLHVSAYVNLNDKVHQLGSSTPKLKSRSSFAEYVNDQGVKLCQKEIILNQFKDSIAYKLFAESSVAETMQRRSEVNFVLRSYLLE